MKKDYPIIDEINSEELYQRRLLLDNVGGHHKFRALDIVDNVPVVIE